MTSTFPAPTRARRGAVFVAAGILLSRLAGLVRLQVFAHYFGLESDAADAFNAAFRIPNFLQNLFGEGALSASFIPVYAALVARGERREADRVAGAVGSLLALVVAVLVLLGVLATPLLIAAIAPGFTGAKRELTIALVRILFPGAGLLVLSAWCLGVLNSHHRFLLSYAAPVMWNVAMIATLVAFGASSSLRASRSSSPGARSLAASFSSRCRCRWCGALAPDLRFALDLASNEVRIVTRNFAPVFISRGVVQVSAYIDALLASLLPTGAVTGIANAQVLYTLPVSLFGMSVAAAELPTMSGEAMTGEGHAALRGRLDVGLRRIAFFVIPSAMAFLALGDVLVAALLQTGRFRPQDTLYVWGILGGVVSRPARLDARPPLYSSSYYALRDNAHAASLRDRACCADDRPRLPVRDSVAAPARRSAIVGRGGSHGVRRNRRMGRNAVATAYDEHPHWQNWAAGHLCGETVDGGDCGGGCGMGRQIVDSSDATDCRCGSHPRPVRFGLSGVRPSVTRRGRNEDGPHTVAPLTDIRLTCNRVHWLGRCTSRPPCQTQTLCCGSRSRRAAITSVLIAACVIHVTAERVLIGEVTMTVCHCRKCGHSWDPQIDRM
jgi:putative peptidoglycan lipid II flippase